MKILLVLPAAKHLKVTSGSPENTDSSIENNPDENNPNVNNPNMNNSNVVNPFHPELDSQDETRSARSVGSRFSINALFGKRSEDRIPKRNMLRFSVLPLTMVAGVTPSHHEVTLCDENVESLDLEADVDLVGISFMTATAPEAYRIARAFRDRGKIVVAGGYHATLCTDEVLAHFDAVVKGDAEGAWPRLLEDAEKGKLKRIYHQDPSCESVPMGVPRRDLLKGKEAHYVTVNAVQTGRGCRHGCRYCSITAFHNKTLRKRPVQEVLNELRALPRNFIFVDDNIIADPDYAKSLFEAMKPMKKRWVAQCSIEIAEQPDLLRLAHEAGCRGLFIGIETTSAANLEAVGKTFNNSKAYAQKIKAIRKAGMAITAGMIVGMDDDDRTVFQRTFRFLQRTGIDALQLNILTPLPGTPLFDDFDRDGRIVDKNWSHYDFRHCVIQPARMTQRDLQEGADWLYNRFYRLDRIVVRTLKTLFTCGVIPAYLIWRLNLTYRYDNIRESIKGLNPARKQVWGFGRYIRRVVSRSLKQVGLLSRNFSVSR